MGLPILFPNVPALPGVPQLARSAQFPPDPAPALGTGAPQQALWQSANGAPTWGVFDAAGKLVIDPDTIMNFDNRNEWRVATFPVQNGGFAQYDKVAVPYELSIRVTKGKSKTDRKNFLDAIDNAAKSLQLYKILTPERTYTDVNITRYEVTRRGTEGAFFLAEVDIYFMNIRQVTAQYTSASTATQNAQDPGALPSTSQGLVQPQPTTPAVAAGAQQAVVQAIQ